MNDIIKIFVITLSEQHERQQFISDQFNNINVPFEFIYGINGRLLSDKDRETLYDNEKAKYFDRELTLGEIGCALSHRLVYEKMIKDNIQKAIILEDDIIIKKDFYSIISFFNDFLCKNTVIKLERCYGSNPSEDNVLVGKFTCWHRKKINNEYFIGQPINNPFLTCGYYLDLLAAKKLFSLMPKLFIVADAWWYFRKFIKLRMINKTIVTTNNIFKSLIGQQNETLFNSYKNSGILEYLTLKKHKSIINKLLYKIIKLFYIISLIFK